MRLPSSFLLTMNTPRQLATYEIIRDATGSVTLCLTDPSVSNRPSLLADIISRTLGVAHRFAGGANSTARFEISGAVTESTADAIRALLEWGIAAPLAELYERRGPAAGEPAWQCLESTTESDTLRAWVRGHYRAAGINDSASLALIESGHARYVARTPEEIRVSPTRMAHVRTEDRETVDAYASLIGRGITFPPLVTRARGFLQEGYHRLAAHCLVGTSSVAVIEIARPTP